MGGFLVVSRTTNCDFRRSPPNSLSRPKIKTFELLYNLQALSVEKSRKGKRGFSLELLTFYEDKKHWEKIDEKN